MFRAKAVVLCAVVVAGACAAARPSPRAHVDADAIRETRRGAPGRFASGRAISQYLEARRFLQAGELQPAAEHLRLAVAYDEDSAELRVTLADVYAQLGQLELAEGEARRGLELARGGAAASEAHALLGQLAAARRQWDEASLHYRQAIRIEVALAASGEADPEPWRLLASLYLELGDETAAVRALDDLAAHVRGDGSGFRELGRVFLERNDPGKAERYLRRAIELDPRDVDALRLLARVHEALRRDPDARADHLAILELDADDATALLALGRMALRAGDAERAREWFSRYVRTSPDGADAHVRVVFGWLEAGRAADALAATREALRDVGPDPRLKLAEGIALSSLRRHAEAATALEGVKPDAGELYVSARVALADALSRAGRHDDAEKALAAPLARNPGDVRLVTKRAEVLERAGRARDAVTGLRHALDARLRSKDPADVPDLQVALAEALALAGDPDAAVVALRDAVGGRPRDEALLYALGTAYGRAGQGDAAVAQMRALLALNPDHAGALRFVGHAYADQGVRLDEAEGLVRRALELRPRSADALDALGWVLLRRGELARAVQILEEADALSGADAAILEHLGDAYRAVERPADAAEAYRRALATIGEVFPVEQVRRRASLERKLRELAAPPRRARTER